MKEYIKESHKRVMKEWKEFLLFKKIPITIMKPFNNGIELHKIVGLIHDYLKDYHFISYLEGVYIGEFPELKDRQIQAMYDDGVIYVSNVISDNKTNEDRIAKDIIHEIGHSLENFFGLDLYGDLLLEQEFLAKRHRLWSLLNFDGIKIPKNDFLNSSEYSKEIDDILYKEIGYKKLNNEINGLFLSPYSVTSISEYFSNGFEFYYTGDVNYLKSICPILYNKLEMLDKLVKEI